MAEMIIRLAMSPVNAETVAAASNINTNGLRNRLKILRSSEKRRWTSSLLAP